jgi:Tfp pilus assembly protein PilX
VRRLGDESGWALVTAVLVTALMVTLGLALYAFADGQQAQSTVQRKGDATFNLAEAMLNAEGFIVSRSWPAASNPAFARRRLPLVAVPTPLGRPRARGGETS